MSVQVKGSGTIGGLDEGLVVSGIVTSSTQINVGSNIKLGNAGVVTATSFVGDGSNLTGIDATTINDYIVHAGDTNTKFGFSANDTISFETSGSERTRIDSDGKLIVGTEYTNAANADAAISLFISGSRSGAYGGETTNAIIFDNQTAAVDAGGTLTLAGYSGSQAIAKAVLRGGNEGSASTQAGYFSIFTRPSSGSLTEKLRIDSSGNIGMNTTTASDSTGNCRAYTFSRSDANGQVRIIMKNIGTGFGNGAGYHQGIDGANVFIENRSDGGYLDFSTNDSSSITSKLRIISTGNFAIGNTHGAKKIHISHTGNQKILIDPNYNNNSGGSSNSEANANNVVDSILVRTSFGDNAASQTNAGHKWGIKFQGYNGNDFTQNISKVAAVYAVSEDEAGGYNRNVGLTFHTSPYNTNHREAMRINTTGAVTKPYHPAFAARLGSGNITISSSNTSDMVFNTEEFDNSNSYNTSNGRFTAPVAGKYYFGVQLYAGFDGAGVRVMHANFRVNGTSVAQTDMFGGASNHGGTHYHPTAVGHMFRNLNANDYVTFNLGGFSHTGGQAILYASTGNRFFGYLVG